MRATAVLPVKRFGAAKQRLVEALDRAERAALAEAMLADVLIALERSALIAEVLLVTGEPRAAALAALAPEALVSVIGDPDDEGHSAAAEIGIARAREAGARCVALLPGDCPLLEPEQLDDALAGLGPGRVGVVPDRHGTGTNGLILSPPDAIHPAFGPGSRDRHLALAAAAGHESAVLAVESLALDLDTAADLDALARILEGEPGRAPATASALASLGTRRQAGSRR
jgi:2-phospho-L-lactate guanylyltransferase